MRGEDVVDERRKCGVMSGGDVVSKWWRCVDIVVEMW